RLYFINLASVNGADEILFPLCQALNVTARFRSNRRNFKHKMDREKIIIALSLPVAGSLFISTTYNDSFLSYTGIPNDLKYFQDEQNRADHHY
ncbi:MAG: hypothetical protein ABIN74_13010, partial [Ferruginibacter sp.]